MYICRIHAFNTSFALKKGLGFFLNGIKRLVGVAGVVRGMLKPPLLVITVILSVGDDEVVEEEDSHHFAGLLDAFCQAVVVAARSDVVAGMIMGNQYI